jgi:hypothetical protein
MSELLLQAIAESMEELVVPEGYVIIEQGDRGDAFYVLKEGTASVTVSRLRSCFVLPFGELLEQYSCVCILRLFYVYCSVSAVLRIPGSMPRR